MRSERDPSTGRFKKNGGRDSRAMLDGREPVRVPNGFGAWA